MRMGRLDEKRTKKRKTEIERLAHDLATLWIDQNEKNARTQKYFI